MWCNSIGENEINYSSPQPQKLQQLIPTQIRKNLYEPLPRILISDCGLIFSLRFSEDVVEVTVLILWLSALEIILSTTDGLCLKGGVVANSGDCSVLIESSGNFPLPMAVCAPGEMYPGDSGFVDEGGALCVWDGKCIF